MPLICFASPKGGVGKTTLAANVAGELARGGRRIVALDLDSQNSLRLHFNVPLHDRQGVVHLLPQMPDLRPLVRQTSSGVGLLAYGQTTLTQALALSDELSRRPDLLTAPLAAMLSDPDLIMIADTMPGPSPQISALLPLTDLLVTVLQVDAASVALVPFIESGGTYGDLNQPSKRGRKTEVAFVLNKFDPRTRLGRQIIKSATRHLGARLLGVVYRDETVGEAIAAQKLVVDYAPACKAAQDIAALAETVAARLERALADRAPAGGRKA